MKRSEFTNTYWNQRYEQGLTGWDIGYPSPPIVSYFSQVVSLDSKILFPGAGNGYEAAYLYKKGFSNVYIADYAIEAICNFRKNNPDFPDDQILHIDFFKLEGTFDFIVEQTFFCALHPNQRFSYVLKMKSLLANTGKVIGLLFATEFANDGPPFGGNKEMYQTMFSKHFKIKTMEMCYNSIPSRQNNEFFFILKFK